MARWGDQQKPRCYSGGSRYYHDSSPAQQVVFPYISSGDNPDHSESRAQRFIPDRLYLTGGTEPDNRSTYERVGRSRRASLSSDRTSVYSQSDHGLLEERSQPLTRQRSLTDSVGKFTDQVAEVIGAPTIPLVVGTGVTLMRLKDRNGGVLKPLVSGGAAWAGTRWLQSGIFGPPRSRRSSTGPRSRASSPGRDNNVDKEKMSPNVTKVLAAGVLTAFLYKTIKARRSTKPEVSRTSEKPKKSNFPKRRHMRDGNDGHVTLEHRIPKPQNQDQTRARRKEHANTAFFHSQESHVQCGPQCQYQSHQHPVGDLVACPYQAESGGRVKSQPSPFTGQYGQLESVKCNNPQSHGTNGLLRLLGPPEDEDLHSTHGTRTWQMDNAADKSKFHRSTRPVRRF